MTQKQLQSVMKFQLKNFNHTDAPITNQTIHKNILTDSDGFGTATSKRIYKAFIRWTIKRQNKEDKPWPKNWMDLSVEELAAKII